MSIPKVPAASSAECTDEVAFKFHFSRGVHLSLVAVDIKNGVPKLRFAPSQNVPTLTEEDVAIIVQLTLEGKRPEFFYEGFHPFHPFYISGRLFKGYRPRYLRGTSIGETLAEADWAMKCLHVGVRSDKEKKRFWSWNETSNLIGLRTREDFDEDLPGASIIMTCDSVDVDEQADELYFVGQPKMRIDCVHKGKNADYAKYITSIFDNVAYHDEPLFLKVQEIVKLVSAVEWLHKKLQENDMTFSRAWVNEHLNKPRESTSQLVEVTVPPDQAEQLMSEAIEEPQENQIDTRVVKLSNRKLSQEGFQIRARATVIGSTYEAEIRGTYNNFDYLLEGHDPNQPVTFTTSNEPLLPNVKSWNELRRETVPYPCSALYSIATGLIGPPITGGVSIQEFKTNNVKCCLTANTESEVIVSTEREVKIPYNEAPKPPTIPAPSKDVGFNTSKSQIRNALCNDSNLETRAGYIDGSSFSISSKNGEMLAEEKQLSLMIKSAQPVKDDDEHSDSGMSTTSTETQSSTDSDNTCLVAEKNDEMSDDDSGLG